MTYYKLMVKLYLNRVNLSAFTLAEVLITLGIIGVVAAMTMPLLINTINDMHYKAAYRKAYSDLSQALQVAKNENLLIDVSQAVTGANNSGGNNLNIEQIVGQMKIIKSCNNSDTDNCWEASGEKFGMNYASPNGRPQIIHSAFIDASGRAWAGLERVQGRIAVDINGFKKPNQYGKDRFAFLLYSVDNNELSGLPFKIIPYSDNSAYCCTGNKCGDSTSSDYQTYYGKSWLMGN